MLINVLMYFIHLYEVWSFIVYCFFIYKRSIFLLWLYTWTLSVFDVTWCCRVVFFFRFFCHTASLYVYCSLRHRGIEYTLICTQLLFHFIYTSKETISYPIIYSARSKLTAVIYCLWCRNFHLPAECYFCPVLIKLVPFI